MKGAQMKAITQNFKNTKNYKVPMDFYLELLENSVLQSKTKG